MFCCTLLNVHSSIAIILMGKRELVALLNLSMKLKKNNYFQFGHILKNSNSTSYGLNSAQVKLDVQDLMNVKDIFPRQVQKY